MSDDPPARDAARAAMQSLRAEGRYREAEALLDLACPIDPDPDPVGHHTVSRGEFYEGWGDHLAVTGRFVEADDRYARAEAHYRAFASWATSGGEGTARMIDVHRVVAKRDGLDGR